jgi:signal transduction histidine kinase
MVQTLGVEYRFFVIQNMLVRARAYAFEAAVLAVIVLTQVQSWTHEDHAHARTAALALLTAGPLLFRRRAPFVAPVVTAAGGVAFSLLDPAAAYDTSTMFFVLLLAAWAAGSLLDARQAGIALAAVVVCGWTVALRAPDVERTEAIWITLPLAGVFALSAAAARRAEQVRRAEARALRSEEEAQAAIAEERSRITRELHDVLAHSVSVMTVQASAVRRLLTPEQEREREALLTVEETGRQALAEMRRLVGIMREENEVAALAPQPGLETLPQLVEQVRQSGLPVELTVEETGRQALAEMRRLVGIMREENEVAALAPQPGLETLPQLVEQVRQSGLPVELTVEGTPVKLPAGVDLSAYRIVQEALTNTLKHAGPAHAWVAVRYAGEDVEIEVANDGKSENDGGGGHGLVGMRERVALCGGELESGPRPGGGYKISARLPVARGVT